MMHRQCPVQLIYIPWEHMAADVFLCDRKYAQAATVTSRMNNN